MSLHSDVTAAEANVTRERAEQLSFYQRHGKRWLDLGVALFAILFFSPIVAAIVMVNVIVYRHLFHRDDRVGSQGRLFQMTKFASMTRGKVTRFGSFIRFTALDELPQLFHVLRGEMSLIGPRPHTVEQFVRLSSLPGYTARTNILPGMTGLAQLAGHCDEDGLRELMIQTDSEYRERCSLLLDLSILCRTPAVFFFGH